SSLSVLGQEPEAWAASRLRQAPSLRGLVLLSLPGGAARTASLARRLEARMVAAEDGASLRSRCRSAARAANADVVVCASPAAPLADPGLAEEMARAVARGIADALAPAPDLTPGLGCLVFSRDFLERDAGPRVLDLGASRAELWPVPRALA